jgi:hypothetical protein
MLVDMDLADAFLADIRVPAITSLRSVDHVVRETGLFQSQAEHDRCMSLLQSAGIEESGRLNIGIKKVRGSVALARQSADRRRHSFCPRSRWHALTPVRRDACLRLFAHKLISSRTRPGRQADGSAQCGLLKCQAIEMHRGDR